MLSMDKRLWNSPEEKTAKKDTKLERKGEREMFLLSLTLQYRKMDLLPRKPHRFLSLFFFFPKFPEHRATITTRILGPCSSYPIWRWKWGKKESGLCCKVHQSLFLSCILPNWCWCETADGGVGAEVRLRVEILGFFKRFPNLHPLKQKCQPLFV